MSIPTDFYTPIDKIHTIIDEMRKAFNDSRRINYFPNNNNNNNNLENNNNNNNNNFCPTTQIKTQINQRINHLKSLLLFLQTEENNIFSALFKDIGKSKNEIIMTETHTLKKEIEETIKQLPKWASEEKINPGWKLINLFDNMELRPEPLGIILIIGAWNYPVSLIIKPLIGAIAAGNTIIIKPSELSPNIAKLISEKLLNYGNLKDIIRVINGGVEETTEVLKYNKFDHILYTGNSKVGRIIMREASRNLTPVTLELGGKSPTIICETMKNKINLVARRILWGRYINAGQTCIAPDYVFVHYSLEKELLIELMKVRAEFLDFDLSEEGDNDNNNDNNNNNNDNNNDKIKKKGIVESMGVLPVYPVETLLESAKKYTKIINKLHFNRISSLIEGCKLIDHNNFNNNNNKSDDNNNNNNFTPLDGSSNTTNNNNENNNDNNNNNNNSPPAEIFCGGERHEENLFFAPTILTNIKLSPKDPNNDTLLMSTEIFGPLLPIIPYKDLTTDVINYINLRPKPLALYIFSEDPQNEINLILNNTSSGGVCINDVIMHYNTNILPFGGIGDSGMGAYHGKYTFGLLSHYKPILYKNINIIEEFINNRVRYPPYSEGKTGNLRALL